MVLYIHIPFCTSKCGYCAFSSYTGVDSSVQQAYIQCLLRDLSYTLSAYRAKKLESILINPALESSLAELDSSDFAPMELDSIYIGGGTPSLLPSSAYALIFEQIARFCDMQSIQEITIEANPNTLQAQWCRDLSRLGVGRISLGVQSFDPRKLAFLERDHSGRDIYHALEIAQVFPHRSIDMMYGTPFDDEAMLRADMQKACALDIDHLSAYSLMIEPGARFAHKHKSLAAPSLAQKDSLEKQAHIVREVALAQGFYHYEVSNFARPYKCLHNRKYWAGAEYLGCGVGAVGRVGQVRYERQKDLRAYLADPLAKACESLAPSDLAFEAVFLGLRSEVGVDIAAVSASINPNRLSILLEEKMCFLRDGRLVARDIFLADEIALWLMRE
ncbi:radical SAM family heme chaperone HemW [Helicobacter zhangjianzhongii]|uniref:Radical SAM family heme chaperone HemW n=1 Tax=Helicobacter zhangjianzhongii TaxID=2974574 RepID=A0ACC6FUI0_9HELI|nr:MULTISPECIES: radical SAM family heme chaperone HemW [unclassified Helicobacter]MDL0080919.1 radical SAM family heme chaperone HemW [Helicobacter sp. CPD2-1]MDL0082953.1 radical SAM family heme chaperone HemW [Helicobacter sp. XJK30-2]